MTKSSSRLQQGPGRRRFLKEALTLGALGYVMLRDDTLDRVNAAVADAGDRPAEELAGHEDFWLQVQRAYDVDRSLINLNNGGVSPAPRSVLDLMQRHVEFTNHVPSRHLWQVLDPQVETVRTRLAAAFGCEADEIAITRNASESLQICLFGIDLKAGDEILTTTHDYPRMLNALKQRQLREGIVVKTFPFPTPPARKADLAALFEQNVTPATKVILVCHITNLTGQIFPVREIVRIARPRRIEVIVDGAHSFGQFPFKHEDLDCDYFGTSLHKWLSAPIGTGFLYVRKSKIAGLWPLTAPPEPQSDNIRKFEEIGTHPTAPYLAIAEALTLHEAIGQDRKAARFRYLRDYWLRPLMGKKGFVLYTSLDADQSCCITTLGIEGVTGTALTDYLFKKHRIVVTPITHEHIDGIRVTPNTYTTLRELDVFIAAMQQALDHGLPS
jgi:selenocysteine lyase/cysteine desulfurase